MPVSRALVAVVASALLVSACGGDDDSDTGRQSAVSTATSTATGEASPTSSPAPERSAVPDHLDFQAELVDGGAFRGESLAGRDAVLYFWAPWCPVCRDEMPEIAEIAADFEDEVAIIGVASLGDVGEMEDFIADTDSGNLQHLADFDGDIWSIYEVTYQYTFAFLNDDGSYETYQARLSRDELTERLDALIAA